MGNIYKWWDGANGITRYVAHVGRRQGAMFRAERIFFVVLDKDYEGKGPLNEGRLKVSTKRGTYSSDNIEKFDTAAEYKYSRKFPQTEGGFHIPQEYWDEYGLE